MKLHESKIFRLLLTIWPALAYVVLAFAVTSANPFRGETAGPFDLLVKQPGWTVAGEPAQARHGQRSDILDALIPRWIEQREQIRQHLIPNTWNPLPAGGEPGFQNLTNAEMTPAFAIFTAAPSPALGFLLAVIFNLSMAGLGAHLWLRRRLGHLPAAFGGITVMLCGFHAAWLYWPHVLTSIWICWVLWALDRWWTGPTFSRFCALTLAVMLMVLGGFPFVVMLGAGTAALYLATLCVADPVPRPTARACGAALAGVTALGLCAIPLIDFVSWIKSFEIGYRHGGSPFTLAQHAKLLLPHAARHAPTVETTMYVGVLPLLLAFATLIVVVLAAFRRTRMGVPGLFSVLLMGCALVLVFELVPARYLAWVPGLGSNQWTRGIIILNIAFAAAAAYSLDLLDRNAGSKLLMRTILMLLIGIQLFDLGSFFRLFNGDTRASFFYPQDRLISRMQRDIRPFQSVIADNNFLISGTLGAYGMPEWFGHAFKSEALKTILVKAIDNPWASPTATMAPAEAINLDSPVMAALGVRYVIGDGGLVSASVSPRFRTGAPGKVRVALPPMPVNHWTQTIVVPSALALHSVDVRLATYKRNDLKGRVSLRLFLDGRQSPPILDVAVPAERILDNAMAVFSPPQTVSLEPGTYRIEMEYQGSPLDDRITVWSTVAPGENCSLRVNGAPALGCMEIQLQTQRSDSGPFVEIASEHGIHLLENRNVPEGPYFIPDLLSFPDATSSRDVGLKHFDAEDFRLDYRGNTAGYLVVPMNLTQDWRVLANGRPAMVDRYLGTLPAVYVKGRASIEFSYRPRSLHYGVWVMSLCILMLAIAGLRWGRRRSRPASQRRASSSAKHA